MLVKVSANFTTKPFASVVGSFSTRMLTPAVASAAGVKFFAPFTVKVVSNLRSTPWLSSPVKVIALSTVVFKPAISVVFVFTVVAKLSTTDLSAFSANLVCN